MVMKLRSLNAGAWLDRLTCACATGGSRLGQAGERNTAHLSPHALLSPSAGAQQDHGTERGGWFYGGRGAADLFHPGFSPPSPPNR